jgi:hypothetical protein
MARCPGCGQLVYKDRATRIGKRYYGPDCARKVLARMPELTYIAGGVSEEDSRKHSYLRGRAK